MTSWGIVGGGMLGLTIAHRLAARGDEVAVFEAADRLGGLADAWEFGGVEWDRHYHVILPVDRALIALLGELGLAGDIGWARTGTDLFDGKRFHPLNGAVDFLRLPVLSLVDKARLAGTILYASRISDGRPLEAKGLEDWLTRLSGRNVFETIWRPLLRAKLGEAYRTASASFIWAIARRLYSARAAGVARDRFGVVEGGYTTVLDRFAKHLAARGVELNVSAPAKAIRRAGAGFTLEAGGRRRHFDRIVVTTPPAQAAALCGILTDGEREAMRGVAYQGIICTSALISRRLRGAYMTYITDTGCPLTTIIDMTAVAGPERFGGRTLAYLPMYLPADHPLFDADEAEIRALAMKGLRQLYPDIRDEEIAAMRVSRARHVLPIPRMNYSDHLPPLTTSVPGLYAVNSAHIVNGTLNVNETIELADRALGEIDGDRRSGGGEARKDAA